MKYKGIQAAFSRKFLGSFLLILIGGLLCKFLMQPGKEAYLSQVIGDEVHFKIIRFKVGEEGCFGELNRSWIIEFEDRVDLKNLPFSAWKAAKPEYSIAELSGEIDTIGAYKYDVDSSSEQYQVVIPSEVVKLKGVLIARVVNLENNRLFVKLERS